MDTLGFVVEIIREILSNKGDTQAWIRKSNLVLSYHRLLVLKCIMMLSLICLQIPEHSQILFELLLGRNNVTYLLPQKFVSSIPQEKNGRYLNLNPEMVAEAFMSINDPLMVVNSENASQRIHAPSAIFVELSTSREEIMSKLFPRKATRSSQASSSNVGVGTVLETPASDMFPDANLNVKSLDGCKVEPQMNWKVLEEISEATRSSQPSSSNAGVGTVLETPASDMFPDANLNVKSLDGCKVEPQMNCKVLEEISESLNQMKGESLSFSSIKKELDKDIHVLATALADGRSCVGEDIIHKASDELKLLSSAFDTSEHKEKEKHTVFKSDVVKSLQAVVESLKLSKPLIDDFLNQSVMSQDSKVEEKVVSESSSTNGAHKEDDHVQETGNEDGNVEDSPVEKQSGGDNIQDPKNKKGKGNNKGKKKKKGNGKTNVEDSPVEMVAEKQSGGGGNIQDPKNQKGKGNNNGKKKKKGKGKNK